MRDAGRLPLSKVMLDSALTEPGVILELATEMTKTVDSLHRVNLVFAELEVNTVVVKNWLTRERVS